MTLLELKKSLSRLPSDFNDEFVILVTKTGSSSTIDFSLLAYVGVIRIGDRLVPALGSDEAAIYQAAEGSLKNGDGTPVDL